MLERAYQTGVVRRQGVGDCGELRRQRELLRRTQRRHQTGDVTATARRPVSDQIVNQHWRTS